MNSVVVISGEQQTDSGGTNDKEPACQCRRHKRHWFNAWVGKEDMANHSSILAWRVPMDRETWWLPKVPSHPGCHITLSRSLCGIQ